MKQIIATFLLAFCALTVTAQSYTRQGTVFTQVVTKKASAQLTGFTFTDSKGNNYPIYVTENGRCYIMKISSKTGKEYKSYLKEDISRAICKELGRTYVPSKK